MWVCICGCVNLCGCVIQTLFVWEPLISLIQDQKRAIDEFSCGIRCETVIAGDVGTPDMCDVENGEVNIGAWPLE